MKQVKVFLRQKPISKGRLSLYLDFYPPVLNPQTGKKTRREFLNIYILQDPKNRVEKNEVKQKMRSAETIRMSRELEIINGSYNIQKKGDKTVDFLQYFKDHVSTYENSTKNTYKNMKSAYNRFKHFCKGKAASTDITREFVENYRKYLDGAKSFQTGKSISQNSKVLYFTKFKGVVLKAHQNEIFSQNPTKFVKGFKQRPSKREYLTIEELKVLFNTPIEDAYFRNICLFAAYTGLRFSDIKKLKWGEVAYSEKLQYHIKYTQQKTSSYEVLSFPKHIFDTLGDRKDNDDLVFDKMKSMGTCRLLLMKWIENSGINKHITFHCFRHTYATLQLANGTDLFTLSKMLGHKDIKTTQIYAKVMDNAKVKAANAIPVISF